MIVLAALLTICAPGPRDNCVVDPDTVWLNGQKIRLLDINGPELSWPKCPAERSLAIKGRDRLLTLLNSGKITLERHGRDRDRYGRLLRIVKVDGVPVSEQLIAEGLVKPWQGRSGGWC